MKKLNRAGFTLIELLAVITIMGILMLVAIPSVSRTIENSRRDTFMDNTLIYVDTVRTAVLSGEIVCNGIDANAAANGTYYFVINTKSGEDGYQQTVDLMETVAKSSWQGNDISGYVEWTRDTSASNAERTITTYSVCLEDTADHGMAEKVLEKDMSRSKVLTEGAGCPAATGTVCTLK